MPMLPLLGALLALLAVLLQPAAAKVYERCELARELRSVHGVPQDQLGVWVCIARHESEYNTTAVGHANGDGSGDHGLFQISDLYWCGRHGPGKACGVSCAQLLDDNIADDVECMRRIYREHQGLSGNGFNAWAVYPLHCKRRADKYVEGCFTGTGNELEPVYGLPPPAITAPPPHRPPHHAPPHAVYGPPTTPAPAPAPLRAAPTFASFRSSFTNSRFASPRLAAPSVATRGFSASSFAAPSYPTPSFASSRFGTSRFAGPRTAAARTTPSTQTETPFWKWQFLPQRRWF